MKKLFFTALVAVVALGGAYAQYVQAPNTSSPQFYCNGMIAPYCPYPVYLPDSSDPIESSDSIYSRTYI